MRHLSFVVSAFVLVTACNSKPQSGPENNNAKLADSIRFATDTAGLAEYQQWKAQNELGNKKTEENQQSEATTSPHTEKQKISNNHSPAQQATAHDSGTMSSESGNSAKAKKGWSKTAKGAVIGGVVGAGTGAVVNKKNRAAGAVIGGAIGAGAGAIIVNEMDKKDGRH